MGEQRGVTLERAGEIIGGDKPLSKRTISAMIARGDLTAYGERGGRRVTTRSIRAYLERGETCPESASERDAPPVPAMLPNLQMVRGGRSIRRSAARRTWGG